MSWLFCLLCCIVIGLLQDASSATISFPETITTAVNNDTYFQCSITLSVDEANTPHGIRWTKDYITQIASMDSVPMGEKYFLSGSSTNTSIAISQTLLITNIVEADLGTYQCSLLLNNTPTNVKASARLFIENFIPSPMCLMPEKTLVVPGEQITLQCIADPSDPALEMSWSNTNGTTVATTTQLAQEPLRLDYTFNASSDVGNNLSYSCTVFSEHYKSCTVLLFLTTISTTLAPITVRIVQSPSPAQVGQDVQFTCLVGEDSPSSRSISWSLPSQTILHQVESRTLTIYNVQSSYDGLGVTCTIGTTDGQHGTETVSLSVINSTTLDSIQTNQPQTTNTITTSKQNTPDDKFTTNIAQNSTDSSEPVRTSERSTTGVNQSYPPSVTTSNIQSTADINSKLIITIVVSGCICLLLVIFVVAICCHWHKPQVGKSTEQDLNSHMEYYKTVSVENEIKEDRLLEQQQYTEINNLSGVKGSSKLDEFDGDELYQDQIENDIYYVRDDGWEPPDTSQQTTTL